MNVLRDVLLNLQRKYAFEFCVEAEDVYRIGDIAFLYTDLEQVRVTPSNVRNRLYTDYLNRCVKLYQLTSDVPAMKLRNFIISKMQLHRKIGARQCIVKECPVEEYSALLTKFHIQGAAKSHKRLGLYNNDSLVSAIGVNRTDQGWLLNRLVFSDVAVIGGAGKLLSAFRKTNSGRIETFSNNAYSDGGVYKALGFRRDKGNKNDMWYVDTAGKLLNRRAFQKHKLIRVLNSFDPALTELTNMLNSGYGVYYGPGTVRWVLE